MSSTKRPRNDESDEDPAMPSSSKRPPTDDGLEVVAEAEAEEPRPLTAGELKTLRKIKYKGKTPCLAAGKELEDLWSGSDSDAQIEKITGQ